MLYWISVIINFVFLIAAVWLGIYIVSRSPRNLVAWLTGLTLWSVASLFLNMLLAFNPPPLPENMPSWVPLLFPFWPAGTTESGWSGWLQGWFVIPAIVFWHHATVILRPGNMNWWRWTRVIAGYALAVIVTLTHLFTDLVFSSASGDPLYLNSLIPGPIYPLFVALVVLFTLMSLIHLRRSARSATVVLQRKQLNILAIATLIAGLTDRAAVVEEGCRRVADAGASALQTVVPALSPGQRRRLSEEGGEAVYHALFHGAAPRSAPVVQRILEAGLEPWAARPSLGLRGAAARNRELAYFRAARWVDRETRDVGAIAREGNLAVIDWLDAASREAIERFAAGEKGAVLRELAAELGAAEEGETPRR